MKIVLMSIQRMIIVIILMKSRTISLKQIEEIVAIKIIILGVTNQEHVVVVSGVEVKHK